MLPLKNVYRGKEVKFYDYFKDKTEKLIEDFLKIHPSYLDLETDLSLGKSNDPKDIQKYAYEHGATNKPQAWQVAGVRTQITQTVLEHNRVLYPTAFEIFDHFGIDKCTMAGYSSFEPNTILRRHTGPENRDAKIIRIHIPLIIPEGDVGFEVHGEEVYWTDIFAFNNQKAHSAWNLTNYRRLVFLIDLPRAFCDLPPAPAWFQGCNDNAPRFTKTETEGSVWKSIAE